MTALNKKWLSGLVAGALMAVSVGTLAAEQKTLHIYNWSDYIAPDTVANFEKGVEESRPGAAEAGRQTRSRQ